MMNIFNLFRKQTPQDRFRTSIRKGIDRIVKNTMKEHKDDPLFGGLYLQTIITSYFDHIKNSNDFSALALMSTISGTWNADTILEEEKLRAINKYLNIK